MPSRSNVRIHLVTDGDIVLDELISCAENPFSPAIIQIYQADPNPAATPINRPLLAGYMVTGVLIVPPPGNTYEFNFGPTPLQLGIRFHPSNPSFVSLGFSQDPIFLNHAAPGTLNFTFIWV